MTTPLARRAARVLLLDGGGRVLLFRCQDPVAPEAGTYWFTPGGGLEPGESWPEGAARELFEETGLRVSSTELGRPVHAEQSVFSFAGRGIAQDQKFFVHRVDSHAVDTTGFNALELASILEHRWWTRAELAATADTVYPASLADLLDQLDRLDQPGA